MRFHWRPPIPGGPDPELLWGALFGISGVMAALWLRWGLPTPLCPLHALTGIPCPTCGMTRAVAALLHGKIRLAFLLNPLTTSLLFAVAFYVGYAAVVVIGRLPRLRWQPLCRTESLSIRIAAILLIAANWIYLLVAGKS